MATDAVVSKYRSVPPRSFAFAVILTDLFFLLYFSLLLLLVSNCYPSSFFVVVLLPLCVCVLQSSSSVPSSPPLHTPSLQLASGEKIRSLTKFVAELEQVYCQSPEIRGDHFKPGTCIIRLSPFVRLMCLTVCHSQQSDVQRTGAVKSRKKIRWFSSILIRLHHYLILLTSTFESHGLRSRRAHLHVVGKLWFMFFT